MEELQCAGLVGSTESLRCGPERQAQTWCVTQRIGGVCFGKESNQKIWIRTGTAGYRRGLGWVRSGPGAECLGSEWFDMARKSNYNIWSWFGGLVQGIAGHGMAHLGAAGYRSGSVRK